MITVVPFYAAILAILFLILSIRVIKLKRIYKISLGDGGHPELCRAIGVHNNFCQYVPFTLLLFTFNELQLTPLIWINFLCTVFVGGRILHAYGVSRINEKFKFRSIGMITTFLTIFLSIVTIFVSLL